MGNFRIYLQKLLAGQLINNDSNHDDNIYNDSAPKKQTLKKREKIKKLNQIEEEQLTQTIKCSLSFNSIEILKQSKKFKDISQVPEENSLHGGAK